MVPADPAVPALVLTLFIAHAQHEGTCLLHLPPYFTLDKLGFGELLEFAACSAPTSSSIACAADSIAASCCTDVSAHATESAEPCIEEKFSSVEEALRGKDELQ